MPPDELVRVPPTTEESTTGVRIACAIDRPNEPAERTTPIALASAEALRLASIVIPPVTVTLFEPMRARTIGLPCTPGWTNASAWPPSPTAMRPAESATECAVVFADARAVTPRLAPEVTVPSRFERVAPSQIAVAFDSPLVNRPLAVIPSVLADGAVKEAVSTAMPFPALGPLASASAPPLSVTLAGTKAWTIA